MVKLVQAYLTGRSTTILFGDFESDPKSLSIGLPQGSPLSVILYILYNSSLLTQAIDLPHTSSLGFVDDVAFLTADKSLDTVRRRLQVLANRELTWGSRHGAAFDQRKSQWIVLTRRALPDILPSITLGAKTLLPQPQVKWLGVVLDQQLNFTAHGRALEKKGTKVVLQLARLARTGWGIPLVQCLQLITSLVHSRTDYAVSIWHRHAVNTAVVKAIQRIDNTAQRFALGVFRTHPLLFLKHDTASPSALQRLNAKAEKAMARTLTLPESNPAAVLARQVLQAPRSTHKSGAHYTFQSPTSVFPELSLPLERVLFTDTLSLPNPRIHTLIAKSKRAAYAFVSSQLGPLTKHDRTRVLLFSDGSLIPGSGVGAAALHSPSGELHPACLGSSDAHTVYEAELVGIRLAADAARARHRPFQRCFWFFIDNQATIRALSQRFTTTSALSLRKEARQAIESLLTLSPHSSVTLVWCPAHVGIHENEVVDEAAKSATTEGVALRLPLSLSALRQQINQRSKQSVLQTPSADEIRRLRGVFDPVSTRRGLMALARPEATAIAQLRANHSPLSHFLHRIKVADHPGCEFCHQPETTEHYLLTCRNYLGARTTLFASLRKLRIPRKVHSILTTPQAFQPLATFIKTTGRFERARRWKPTPEPVPPSAPAPPGSLP